MARSARLLVLTAVVAGATLSACGSTIERVPVGGYAAGQLSAGAGTATVPGGSTAAGAAGGAAVPVASGSSAAGTSPGAVTGAPGSTANPADVPGTTANGVPGAVPSVGSTVARGTDAKGKKAATGTSAKGAAGKTSASGKTGSSTAGAAAPAASAPYVLGITEEPGATNYTTQLGGQDVESDTDTFIDYMTKYVNAHGGMGGHPLQVLRTNVDANNNDNADQEECAAFTQDTKVQAVTDGIDDTVANCMSAAGTIIVAGDLYEGDNQRYAAYPDLFDEAAPTYDAMAGAMVSGLAAQGFFTGQTGSVGVIYVDCPPMARAVTNTLLPALAKIGVTSPLTSVSQCRSTSADEAQAIAEIPNIVLNFQSKGIQRVLFFTDAGGLGEMLFMTQADKQGYHPRYGLSTLSTPVYLANPSNNVPADQLTDSVGVGWIPDADVNNYADYHNDQAKACLGYVANAGITLPTDGLDEAGYLNVCDEIFLLKAEADKAGGDISGPALIAAGGQLGTSLPSAGTFGTDYTANRHAGASYYRRFAYVASCSCFQYSGGNLPFSP